LGGAVQAAPIDGEIFFGGTGTPTLGPVGSNFFDVNNAFVNDANGDFSTIFIPTVATFNDFYFDGSNLPVSPLWTVGGFSFELDTIVSFDNVGPVVGAIGSGTMTGGGFDPTPFAWSFSSDTSGGGSQFAFSSTNVPVPDPATLGVLGIGLMGLGFAAYRRRRDAA
jgi:hypothetical protein